MDKNQLRKELKSLRNRLSKEEVAAKSSSVCRKILGTAAYRNAGTVFAYLAFGNEVNIDGVISQALTDGKTVCVPVVTGPHSMQAVKLESLNCIKEGAYGIRVPQGEPQAVNPSGIGLVLVPGLGFDLKGGRMGMGAGYYDRFLPQCVNAVKTGITYDILLRGKIICDEHDVLMDYIITESQVAKCR